MVRFWTPAGLDVSLGFMAGRFSASEFIAELARAHGSGDQRPGQDRLTLVDPLIDPSDITVYDLYRIRLHAAFLERTAPKDRKPLSVYIAGRGIGSIGIQVYFDLWDQVAGPRPEFHLCHNFDEAERLLGCTDLAKHFQQYPLAEWFIEPSEG